MTKNEIIAKLSWENEQLKYKLEKIRASADSIYQSTKAASKVKLASIDIINEIDCLEVYNYDD